MSLRLGCDVDGVLANFDDAYQAVARQLFNRSIEEMSPEDAAMGDIPTREAARVWAEISRAQNWWVRLPSYEPFQIERLYRLMRSLKWEVVFFVNRPPTQGDSAQFQTQWWLETQGFYLPSVLEVQGSRGEIARALKLDLVLDDRLDQCIEIVGASQSKAILVQRSINQAQHDEAIGRGIGVVPSLEHALDVAERLHELVGRHPRINRLTDWFGRSEKEALPLNPRAGRPLPEATVPDFDVPDIDLD